MSEPATKFVEIKPCPVCGSDAGLSNLWALERMVGYTVECSNRECMLHRSHDCMGNSASEAVEAWNRRAE